MPIFFQQDIDATTKLAIWKIGEGEDFFLRQVPLQRTITHPHKRLQHLAGRYLLKQLFPAFPIDLIRVADTRKPFLEDEAYHFSISHCGDFAGVIASPARRVGIDIELQSEKIWRIRHKFISGEEEQKLAATLPVSHPTTNRVLFPTILWSCKEAVFKWYGLGGMDFRKHMQLRSITRLDENDYRSVLLFSKTVPMLLDLQTRVFGRLCMSYVFT